MTLFLLFQALTMCRCGVGRHTAYPRRNPSLPIHPFKIDPRMLCRRITSFV